MDTPEKPNPPPEQQQQKPISTPLSRFEDSPVFNYINSLSPINPVKSFHITQTYQFPNFASIPSVFTSPHISKESRFSLRHSIPDLSNPENFSSNGDENDLCIGISDAVKLSDTKINEANCENMKCSLNEATIEPPDESPKLPDVGTHSLEYSSGSPDHNVAPFYVAKRDVRLVTFNTQSIESAEVGLQEKSNQLINDAELPAVHYVQQPEEEPGGYVWENMISNDTEDLLNLDSSTEAEVSKDHTQDVDHECENICLLSRPLDFVATNSQNTEVNDCLAPCSKSAFGETPSRCTWNIAEQNEIIQAGQIVSTSLNKSIISKIGVEMNSGAASDVSLGNEVDPQQHRGMRRRCLIFEMTGKNGNNSHAHPSDSSSTLTQCHGRKLFDERHLTGPTRCVLPSIGLHLNYLSSAVTDGVAPEGNSEKHQIGMTGSLSMFSLPSGQKSLGISLPYDEQQESANEVQDSQIMHEDTHALAIEMVEEENLSSPKKKKHKPEINSESEACKRCNCKKSKCLKLYCECFAAGVYCVEPCACQGCFNKPIHEDTVIATRKQIESRNPLAFAPKVIRTSELIADAREESNTTPASVRHKRGCNCKKSGCLKKYCECYQGGAGCSVSCRCEGCKNTFGRKDGKIVTGSEYIEHNAKSTDECEKNKRNPDVQHNVKAHNDPLLISETVMPLTPSFQICRSSVKLPFPSSGKPPRSSVLTIGSSVQLKMSTTLKKCEIPSFLLKSKNPSQICTEHETPGILRENPSPVKGVKVVSPNGKRVSPPHTGTGTSPTRKGSRKLILKSIPSFPSLTSD